MLTIEDTDAWSDPMARKLEVEAIRPGDSVSKSLTRIQTGSQIRSIKDLGHDVLLYIFSFSLYLDDNTFSSEYFNSNDWSVQHESSLTDIRWWSQVCRYWRHLTLHSTSLWAHSINLRLLNQSKNQWREEVMRRTGDAPLSVRGVISMAAKPSTDLLLYILEAHWTRVRILNVAISYASVMVDYRWQALYRPAPNLEIFRLMLPTAVTSISSSAADTLFSGSAPQLYHFRYSHMLLVPVTTVSWTPQIRTLIITSIRPLISQVFDILSHMPLIEVLEIHGGLINLQDMTTFPLLSPSRLRILKLLCTSRHAAIVMRYILPPVGCRLVMKAVVDPHSAPDAEETLYLHSSLSRYFSNSVNFYRVKRIYWRFTDEEWNLSTDNSQAYRQINCSMLFQTYFSGDFGLKDSSIPLTLLSAFSECGLGRITSLEMEIISGIDSESVVLHSFLRAFISVETMYTQSDTLGWLNDVLAHNPNIFPRLTTLVFVDGLELTLSPATIMRFLLRRRDAGIPIKTFDIRKCRTLHQELLLFLEGIDGLLVLWDLVVRRQCDVVNRGWTDVDRDSD